MCFVGSQWIHQLHLQAGAKSPALLSISSPNIDRLSNCFTGTLCGKFAIVVIKYTTTLQPHRYKKIVSKDKFFCVRIYSDYSDFCLKIYISQGSVATQLRCLSIFSNHFVTNLLQNVPVKKIENRPIFLANILIKVCGNFGGHPVYRTGIYLWIWIYLWISTQNLWIWIWIGKGNFISTATLEICSKSTQGA